MADVLKGGRDGCLPLMFDDAFTNSDPRRVDLVKQMLATAVDRGLQVILLTRRDQAQSPEQQHQSQPSASTSHSPHCGTLANALSWLIIHLATLDALSRAPTRSSRALR